MRAALVFLTILVGFAPQASAAGLMQTIWQYECKQANADGLAFRCGVNVNSGVPLPIFTISREMEERDKYRYGLLVLRFFQLGGVNYRVVSAATGKQRSCAKVRGKKFATRCNSWNPTN